MSRAANAAVTRCNCLALRQSARFLSGFYDSVLAPSGLRGSQFSLLAALSEGQPLTMSVLAEQMVMDRTTLARNLKPLARDGLVSIEAGEDRRVRLVSLTAQGKARFALAMPLWREAQRKVENDFGYERTKQLRATLGELMRLSLGV